MSKSMLFIHNTTDNAVAANGVIPLGSAVHGYGCGIELAGNAITLSPGYYLVNASIVATAVAAGVVTADIYINSVGSDNEASVTAAANDLVTLPVSAVVRVPCGATSTISFVNEGGAVTVNNISAEVVKIR